jgi:hypothetical protein
LALKYWSRLYTPDVILGVYSSDELDDRPQSPIFPVSLDTSDDVVEKTIAAIQASTTLDELAIHRATALTFKGTGKRRAGAAINAKREELTSKPVEQIHAPEPEHNKHGIDLENSGIADATIKDSLIVDNDTGEIRHGERDPLSPNTAVLDWIANIGEITTKSDISRAHTEIMKDGRLTAEEKSDLTDELRARQAGL